MTQPNPSDDALNRELADLRLRVQNGAAACYLWENILTASEKKRLGDDLDKAYSRGATIGMWIRLHGGRSQEALLDVAVEIGLLSEQLRRSFQRLLGIGQPASPASNIPEWNLQTRELHFAGQVVRRVLRPNAAKNVVRVLDEFQLKGWPPRIDDPGSKFKDQQRLHATIRTLNTGLARIRFKADGTGAGYMWSRV